jgi:hypothetical protein
LKPGDIIRIYEWHGVVLETHFDEAGALTVIRVQTARNVFRGYGAEYVDVRLNSGAMAFATVAELEQEIQTHRRVLEYGIEQLLERIK